MNLLDNPTFYLIIGIIVTGTALYFGWWIIAFMVAFLGIIGFIGITLATAFGWILLFQNMVKR